MTTFRKKENHGLSGNYQIINAAVTGHRSGGASGSALTADTGWRRERRLIDDRSFKVNKNRRRSIGATPGVVYLEHIEAAEVARLIKQEDEDKQHMTMVAH